jgi:hypothetical protein
MAIKDAEHIVRTCKACQFAAKHQRRHGAPSQLMTPTWPLQRWGMDIIGPLPTAQGTSSSRWSQSSISPNGLRRDLSLPSPQPPSENSFGSKSSVDLECPESSPLTTGSNSIARISGSIVV